MGLDNIIFNVNSVKQKLPIIYFKHNLHGWMDEQMHGYIKRLIHSVVTDTHLSVWWCTHVSSWRKTPLAAAFLGWRTNLLTGTVMQQKHGIWFHLIIWLSPNSTCSIHEKKSVEWKDQELTSSVDLDVDVLRWSGIKCRAGNQMKRWKERNQSESAD